MHPSPLALEVYYFLSALFLSSVGGALYEIGEGKQFTNIRDAPLSDLVAGDEVHIFWRPTPYFEKFVIGVEGTESQPIVFKGMPSQDGNKPIIDGAGALNAEPQNYWGESRGLIKIGGSNTPDMELPKYPQWIVIEGFEIRNAHLSQEFIGRSGETEGYADNAAGIYIEFGRDIILRNNVVHSCSNGIFSGVAAGNTQRITVEGNYIYGNGNIDDIYVHNSYMASVGITYQYNHYGPLCDGCSGNNLKDRSGGCVIAYNYIENGNRQLDLVDDEDGGGLENTDFYHKTFVYGNIFFESSNAGNRQMIHYGGDSGNTDVYRKGTLYLYNNHILSNRNDKFTLLRLSSNDESADVRNNIIYSHNQIEMEVSASLRGTMVLTNNWINAGWGEAIEPVGGGTVTAIGNIEGDPGFVDFDQSNFFLGDGSLCIGSGTTLHEDVLPDHDITTEYVHHTMSKPRCNGAGNLDIGAFAFIRDCADLTETPAQVPAQHHVQEPEPAPELAPDPALEPAPEQSDESSEGISASGIVKPSAFLDVFLFVSVTVFQIHCSFV